MSTGWQRYLAAAAYFLLTSLGHLAFSLWLVRPRDWGLGPFAFKDAVPLVSLLAGLALLAWLARDMRREPRSRVLLPFWLLWAVAVLLIDRYLTFSINEYAHFPQYALLALLLARAMDPQRQRLIPGRILFWASLLGAIDEAQQYVWLAPSYGEYMDFNDCLVNLIGAAAGVLIYYRHGQARAGCLRRDFPRAEILTSLAIVVAIAGGFASERLSLAPPAAVPPGGLLYTAEGRLQLHLQRRPGAYDSWNAGHRRPQYRVLGPVNGLALTLLGGVAFAGIGVVLRGRRVHFSG